MKEEGKGKQIGVLVNPTMWKRFRMLALEQDRTATDLVNEAMREYIERHASNPRWGSATDRPSLAQKGDRVTRSIENPMKKSIPERRGKK